MRYNKLTGMSKIKTTDLPSIAIYVEKTELLYAGGRNLKLQRTLENSLATSFKVKLKSTMWLSQV